MNTLKVEALLAEKYGYKPLPGELSEKYRRYFRDNMPDWLSVDGADRPLYTSQGTKICPAYTRVVIGDYGAFVEFEAPPENTPFIIRPGQEYRVSDPKYSRNVKYIWLTIDDGSDIKIYRQRRTVPYADYKPGLCYASVHEVYQTDGKESK